jgi:hypothetical protein
MKLKNNIVTMRKVEVIKKDSMVEEVHFPDEEDEEEQEEVYLDAIHVERKDTSLGNVPGERTEEELKHTLSKHRSMWKKKLHKEEGTS